MKLTRVLLPLAALFCLTAPHAEARDLRTRRFAITITENCPEGEVGCSDVTYVGTHMKTGKSITLKGKAVMHMCPDRVTPCSHEGYEFKSGNVEYRVKPDGSLLVTRGAEVLFQEQGKWQP